jgi:hypothetical protein
MLAFTPLQRVKMNYEKKINIIRGESHKKKIIGGKPKLTTL